MCGLRGVRSMFDEVYVELQAYNHGVVWVVFVVVCTVWAGVCVCVVVVA